MSVVIESYRRSITKLCEFASTVPDPRQKRGVRHKIDVILVIFVLALLCDQNDFVRIEDWAKSEYETLQQVMDLPHGIPSHDTFMRVVGTLSVESIETLFMRWITLCYPVFSNHLAIDGKTVNSTVKVKDWETDQKEAQKNRDDKSGHGRIERREYRVLSSDLPFYLHDNWTHIRCLIEVQSHVMQKSTGKETTSTRYYVSSKQMTAQEVSETVRGHWHIEAGLHAVLDGTFCEDECKSRQKCHAQNLVIFRHLVCGILRKHEDKKRMTVSMKRTHCRNDLEYRIDVLSCGLGLAA